MSELTNLLPIDKVRATSRDYFLRLATVALVAVAVLVLIHGALLAPTYLYLSEEVKTRQAHFEGLSASLASSEERAIHERLSSLAGQAEQLLATTNTPTATAAIREVLSLPRGGVAVTGITISPVTGAEGQMRIMGIAPTRESLRKYSQALATLPFVSRADLPLSVYAAENDITFSIAITGTLTP